jgi:hypothetical protein
LTWSFGKLQSYGKWTLALAVGGLLTVIPIEGHSFKGQLWAQTAGQSSKQPAVKSSNQAQVHPVSLPTRMTGSTSLPAARAGWAYPQKQTLTYEVDWRVFPAGTAVLHMESNGDSQRLTVTGDSLGAFNLLLRVNDHFQSTFSRQTGCSSGFAKQLIEGSKQVNSEQQFGSGLSRTTDDERNLITHSHHAEQTAIPPCVTDALSAAFYAASQPLQVGGQFHVPLVYGANLLDVTAHVEGEEAVRTPTATYQTLRVQPTWTNTAVRNSGNIWIWYTNDDRHIPVQVRARLFWGTITFRLTGIEQK